MRLRRHPSAPDAPSPAVPVALAVAALAVLLFARWWLARPVAPAALDGGSYVAVVAPVLHRAGCAALACHGNRSPMRLAPSLVRIDDALAELSAVRPVARSLVSRATSRAHAGVTALDPAGCEARALARWVGGAVVRPCP